MPQPENLYVLSPFLVLACLCYVHSHMRPLSVLPGKRVKNPIHIERVFEGILPFIAILFLLFRTKDETFTRLLPILSSNTS